MIQIQEKYQILSRNNQGTFFKALSKKDSKEVAIKKIFFANMTEKDKKNITEQVNLLRSIKSNNIVRYYDYNIDKTQANLYIIMEYCSGESLEQYLQFNRDKGTYIEQKVIWKIFSEIVSAVNQIHNDPQGSILHRDIKPKAILLDKDNNVKLGNFNLLRRLNPQQQFALTYIAGTYYKSPEQIVAGIYGTQSDIWALGCLLYQMAALKPPFKKNSQFLTAQSIKQEKVQNIPSIYSQQLRRVINWCLQKQRQNRPTASMLKSVPEINYRIRKARLSQYMKSVEQKEQKLMKKQQLLSNMQQKIKQLQALSYLQQDKENYQMENWVRNCASNMNLNYNYNQ